MAKPQDLRSSSRQDVQKFLDSFDTILTDCDGVLWLMHDPIDGALEVMDKLRKLGKNVYFVSNNSSLTTEQYQKKLKRLGFDVDEERIIHPARVIAWHLKNIGFEGEAYVIATTAFRQVLTDAGINVVPLGTEEISEDLASVHRFTRDNPSIKAVIAEFDLNLNWVKLMRAIVYLKRDDCLYLSGALDNCIPIGTEIPLLGAGGFIRIINEMSGREPIQCAKPSEVLKKYVLDKCNIFNPKRCVFVGDTTKQDMKFGSLCGFKKFFVSSGNSSLEEAMKEDDTTPDLYLPSLGHLLPLLETIPVRNTCSTNGC